MKYQVLVLLVAILLPNIGMGKLTYSNDDIYYNEREGLNTGDSMATNEEQEIEYNAGDSEIQYATKEPMREEYTGLPQSMDSVQLASELFQCTCTGKGGKSLGKSCHDIKKNFPDSKSGFYTLLINGRLVRKYCVMETLCGSNAGWTRLASFDAQTEKKCPEQLQLVNTNHQRIHCARKQSGSQSCARVPIPSDGIKYSKICGRVSGYQFYSTDGYRDGVAITQGPLQSLVWSFIAGFTENHNHCPCAENGHRPPSDIGKYNFCESGFKKYYHWPNHNYKKYAIEDPLWDGKDCNGKERRCCRKEGVRKYMPFFLRETDLSSEDLAVRLCCDESTDNENVSVGSYEIYVQ